MLEDLMMSFSEMGINYNEDGQGGMTVDISTIDKTTLIEVINVINDNGLEFTIDANSIVINGMPAEPVEPVEPEEDIQDLALDDAMGGMF